MSVKTTLLLITLFAALFNTGFSQDSVLDWECDVDILASQNQCIMVRTDDEIFGPHNSDQSVGELGFRRIQSQYGEDFTTSGESFTNCDILVGCSVEISGMDLRFVQLFEMMAPIRDLAFFAPNSLEGNWHELSQFVTDCGLKLETVDEVYSTQDLYHIMQDPNYEDIHNGIIQYLEEVQNIMTCLMDEDSEAWDFPGNCVEYRDDAGLAEGEITTCWENFYYNTLPTSYSWDFDSSIEVDVCAAETEIDECNAEEEGNHGAVQFADDDEEDDVTDDGEDSSTILTVLLSSYIIMIISLF